MEQNEDRGASSDTNGRPGWSKWTLLARRTSVWPATVALLATALGPALNAVSSDSVEVQATILIPLGSVFGTALVGTLVASLYLRGRRESFNASKATASLRQYGHNLLQGLLDDQDEVQP